jgi:uncharacterized membrane protein YgdD (TMEM256/DUF423 family)
MKISIKQVAALLGAITVALGAFGAHGLKPLISENFLTIYETAVKYQFLHTIMLFIVGMLYEKTDKKSLYTAAVLFIVGIILFSGSLYTMIFTVAAGSTFPSWIGPVTPIGGLCLIAGWISLALGCGKTKK